MFPPETETGVVERQPLFSCKLITASGGIMKIDKDQILADLVISKVKDYMKQRDEAILELIKAIDCSVRITDQRLTVLSDRMKTQEDINNILGGNFGSTSGNSGRA